MPEQNMTPEQQEELKRKLENMSPEELREFQKKQCIFCHICAGKVASKKIYEDEHTLGVLDINPANPGHVLLMPKEHYMIMPQLPEDILKHLFVVAKHISNAMLRALEVRGTNILVANGVSAGQRAQHFMIHIIPRKEGDQIGFSLPSNKQSEAELNKVAELLRQKLGQKVLSKAEKQETKQPSTKEAKEQVEQIPPKKKRVDATPKKQKKDPVKKEEKGKDADLDLISRVLNG